MSTLAEDCLRYRKEYDLSRQELAAAANVNPKTVARVEQGRTQSPSIQQFIQGTTNDDNLIVIPRFPPQTSDPDATLIGNRVRLIALTKAAQEAIKRIDHELKERDRHE